VRHCAARFCATLLLLCSIVPCRAQSGELGILRFELKTQAGTMRYDVELYGLRNHQKIDATDVHPDGRFTFRHVPYGDYQLMVVDAAGNPVHQQYITVTGMMSPVTVDITATQQQQRAPGGPISVAQLQHPPTRKAFQDVQAAQKLSNAGNFEKAAEKLREAVEISPYWADAHTNLGVQYIRTSRYAEAEGELSRAVELGGPNAMVLTDLATAQLAEKKYSDAAGTARRALQVESGYPQAHYILGMALCTEPATVREGLQHLREAAKTLPRAEVQIERVQQFYAGR
jgi:tetratricopeptide (TPR) repeat protein